VLSRPLSAAILGFRHVHATGYAFDILESENVHLSAVWDRDLALAVEGLSGLGTSRRGSAALGDTHRLSAAVD
jgi:hypothetical protein